MRFAIPIRFSAERLAGSSIEQSLQCFFLLLPSSAAREVGSIHQSLLGCCEYTHINACANKCLYTCTSACRNTTSTSVSLKKNCFSSRVQMSYVHYIPYVTSPPGMLQTPGREFRFTSSGETVRDQGVHPAAEVRRKAFALPQAPHPHT